MDEKVFNETRQKTSILFEINKITWGVIAFPFMLAFVLVWGYITRFGSCLSDTPAPNTTGNGLEFACLYSFSSEQWGQAGDFLGGILNPLIGLVTVILVVLSIRQNNIALQQNQAALKQNEQALKDSKEELQNSNNIMLQQRHLMEFDLKLNLFNGFLVEVSEQAKLEKKIEYIAEPAGMRTPSSGDFEKKTLSTSANLAVTSYIKNINDKSLSSVRPNHVQQLVYFQNVAQQSASFFIGLHTIYAGFPSNSDFRYTLELSMSIFLKPAFLCGMGMYLLQSSSEETDDWAGRVECVSFIISSLERSGNISYKQTLSEYLTKLNEER